jgi:serine/threonine protein kinase
MAAERWRRVEELYHAALAHDEATRAAFLADTCAGDAALRQEVESLLAQGSDPFLNKPAIAMATQLVSDLDASVLTGRRLGVYQVQSRIGAGGMGEVYRARDLKLGRDVAIKILPRVFTADTERLARFDREARVLASLNDPHIGAIYGFEESEGVRALVLELVEGPTLADRIARGPLPITETLAIARQIAEALDVAHGKGIIHRDLKPANIKITSAGDVKVLDFGLAKAALGDATDLTQASTMLGETREGIILGTAAYMSPEQARGQAVDKRTDVWAFGCVLYEMLTGGMAFGGATLSDTIAAVIEREPDWQALPSSTPAAIHKLLRRCLTKPVGRRLRDIGDAVLDLESASAADESVRTAIPSTERKGFGARSAVTVMAAALAVAAVIVASSTWWRSVPESALTLESMTRLTSGSGLTTEPSISADGRVIAYASNRSGDGNLDVYVQQTSGGAAIRLTDDAADDRSPAVSPDGSDVAFRSDRSPAGIYMVPVFGGNARPIAPDGRAPRFSPDGRSIAYWTGPWLAPRSAGIARAVFVVPAKGGKPTQVAADFFSAGDPVWAPDGQSLLVLGRYARGADADWWWVPLAGGKPIQTGVYALLAANQLDVTTTDIYPVPEAWDHGGVLFSAADRIGDTRALWRIAMDVRSGRPVGDPFRLTRGTTADVRPSVSNSNRVAFAAQMSTNTIFGLPIDANAGKVTGTMRRLRDDDAETNRASLSEDGRLMVFPKYEFASGGVWARDLTTGREWQLAATPRTPLNPVISVDGRWTAYTVTKVDTGGNDGPGDGFVVETARGAPRQICSNCQMDQWTRDGQFVIVAEEGRRRLGRIDVATGKRVPLLEGDEEMDRLQFGPDGRWMTFNVRGHVYLAPVDSEMASPKDHWTSIVSITGGAGRTAGLSPDGSLLYLLLETDGFRCLYGLRLDPKTGQRRETPFVIAHFHDAARRWGSTGLGSAAVKGLFVANLLETTSNIWVASFGSADR